LTPLKSGSNSNFHSNSNSNFNSNFNSGECALALTWRVRVGWRDTP